MYNVSTKLYRHIASLIIERVGSSGYFSGVIDFEWGDVECSLHLTAVIYHETLELPEGRVRCLSDMVPVWWEFFTHIEGDEVFNNFSFNELREFIAE